MTKRLELEIKVGLFVTIGIGLIMLAILILGGTDSFLIRQNHYSVHFSSVEGLISGSKVVLGGIQVGTVETVDFDDASRNIVVKIAVARKYGEWIRKDSEAEIATQGVLGDKYISITTGSADQPILESKSEIINRPTKDITQFLSKGDQLMVSLNRVAGSLDRILKNFETGNRSDTFFHGITITAKNLSLLTEKLNNGFDDKHLKSALKNLDGILGKVNNGTGTLGALINDPALYDDAKTLVGGANRSRIMRNLVRQTIKKGEEAEAAEEEKEKKEKSATREGASKK